MFKITNLVENSKLYKGVDFAFENTGLVFMCGRKESSLKSLIEYMGGFAFTSDLRIELDDFVVTKKNLDQYRLKYMGYVANNSQWVEGLTVKENALLASSIYADKISNTYVRTVLERTHLYELRNTLVSELNEYELHLLDFARALMKDPKILFLNNPVSRLNEKEATLIWKLAKDLSKDHLVIVYNSTDGLAEKYGDVVVSVEATEDNHVITNETSVKVINSLKNKELEEAYPKAKRLSFKRSREVSRNLFKGAPLLILSLILAISVFLVSFASTNEPISKFAETLHSYEVNSVTLYRNTDKDDLTIPSEQIESYEGISSKITIDWGYYYSANILSSGQFKAHQKNYNKLYTAKYNTSFEDGTFALNYPHAMFKVKDSAKRTFKFVAGGFTTNERTGVFISKSVADAYIKYYNMYAEKYNASLTDPTVKLATEEKSAFRVRNDKGTIVTCFEEYGSELITGFEDLVDKHLVLGYAQEYNDLVIGGVFEDNNYLDSIIFTSRYTFPQNTGTTVSNFSKDYSIGIATLSNDPAINAKFIDQCASIIRNEKEFIYVETDIDSFYTPIYNKLSNLSPVLNIVGIVFIILSIVIAAIYSFVQLSTYIKELAIARTHGMRKGEVLKIARLYNIRVLLSSFIGGVILGNLICLIFNLVLRIKFIYLGYVDVVIGLALGASHPFLPFMMLSIPVIMYAIIFGVCIIFYIIYMLIARKMLNKRDMYLY